MSPLCVYSFLTDVWEDLYFMEPLLAVLNLIGTAAFAISGALTAIRKGMDLLGVLILGMVTAVGGGVFRDLVLGRIPPDAFTDPLYAIVSALTAFVVFLVLYFRLASFRSVNGPLFQRVLLISDTIGLAVFSVVGVQAGFDLHEGSRWFLCLFLGTITGVGGGVLRDLLAGDRPYIFYKHIYACASMAGALLCTVLWGILGETPSMLLGAAAVVLIRLLAIRFELNLPRIPLFSFVCHISGEKSRRIICHSRCGETFLMFRYASVTSSDAAKVFSKSSLIWPTAGVSIISTPSSKWW